MMSLTTSTARERKQRQKDGEIFHADMEEVVLKGQTKQQQIIFRNGRSWLRVT